MDKQKQITILKQVIVTFMAGCTAIFFSNAFAETIYDYLHYLAALKRNNIGLDKSIDNTLSNFFIFLLISLSLWVLFSKFLPRNWIFASLVGALFAGLLPRISSIFIFTVENSPLIALGLRSLDSIVLVGFVATIPQWWLLKKNSVAKSYYWLIVNGIGWGIISLLSNLYLTLSNDLLGKTLWTISFNLFPWFQFNYLFDGIKVFAFIPLGLGMGLFFTRNSMDKPKDKNDTDKTESASPEERVRAGKG